MCWLAMVFVHFCIKPCKLANIGYEYIHILIPFMNLKFCMILCRMVDVLCMINTGMRMSNYYLDYGCACGMFEFDMEDKLK